MGNVIRTTFVGATLAAVALLATPAFAANVTVSPSNPDGWADDSTNPSNVRFVNGPATPPAGSGSAEFRITGYGVGEAEIRNNAYNGVKLSDITDLSYYTYVPQNFGGRTVNLILNVDRDNNGSTDDILFFEPRHQSGTSTSPVNTNTWQRWDADTGKWWAMSESFGSQNLTTLSDYVDEYPNATIRNVSSRQGGIRLAAGFQELGNWANFVGYVDNVTINAGSRSNTYNFEAVATSTNPGTGNKPTNKDQCKNGGWMNYGFPNQGQCVSYVNSLGMGYGQYNPWGQQYNPWGYQQAYNPWGYQQQYNPWGYQQAYNPWGYQQQYNPWGSSFGYSNYNNNWNQNYNSNSNWNSNQNWNNNYWNQSYQPYGSTGGSLWGGNQYGGGSLFPVQTTSFFNSTLYNPTSAFGGNPYQYGGFQS